MSFNAKSFRKELNKQLKKQLNHIIEYHTDKIESSIKTYERDKMYLYIVEPYVPGYKEYNPNINGKVYKSIVHRLHQKGYTKIKQIPPNKIQVEWEVTNKRVLKKYISSLIMNIYTMVQDATKQNLSSIEYVIPFHIRYPPHKVTTHIKEHLEKRRFKITQRDNLLFISW